MTLQMSDIVVFPEQLSFDVKVQRNSPRRRLTAKNLGTLPLKVSITPPTSDAFIVTESSGKVVTRKFSTTLQTQSTYILFVQKKPSVGIVPDDTITFDSQGKSVKVALKPAVSTVTLEELEKAAEPQPEPTPKTPKQISIPKQQEPKEEPEAEIETEEETEEEVKISKLPEPVAISALSPRSSSRIDPSFDVLQQSLTMKFAFKLDDFNETKKVKEISWYDDDAFQIEEPEFSFELMLTKAGEDPIFCIDGDYFDQSGRLLSVQQGKPRTVFVTEGGDDISDGI